MPIERLKKLLNDERVPYIVTAHRPAQSAQEVAAAAHVPGRELAKSIVVWVDDHLALAVVPATDDVDLDALAAAGDAENAFLASEEEINAVFTDCDAGMVPPFGWLWGMPVFLSDRLADQDRVSFCPGRDNEIVTLHTEDFIRLVGPDIAPISETWPAGDRRRAQEESGAAHAG